MGWTILHSGALGDLVLTIQLALRLPDAYADGVLEFVSRVNPGDLSNCRPSVRRRSSEGLGLHWLFSDSDDEPPARLRDVLCGAHVLSALGGTESAIHPRLAALDPAGLYSIDPRAQDGASRHITDQWQTQLETQGLLVSKCVHQRPTQRSLGVPDALRERGWAILHPGPNRARGASSRAADAERTLACASGSEDAGLGGPALRAPGSDTGWPSTPGPTFSSRTTNSGRTGTR